MIDVGEKIECKGFKFEPGKNLLSHNNKTVKLTMTESKIIRLFLKNPDKVIESIDIEEFWRDNDGEILKSTDMLVKKYIHRLRRKIEILTEKHNGLEVIVNYYALGYHFVGVV